MGEHVLHGNPPITVTLRVSGRARRLSLRISRLDGRATLTRPNRVPLREAVAFLTEKEGWLRAHLSRIGAPAVATFGTAIPFRGQPLPLVQGAVRRPVLQDGALVLPADPALAAARTLAFLKAEARNDLAAASDRHAATLGRRFRKLTLRDTRSRWGSCSMQGDLMYSWRLIMAPPEVLDYVAAHEVAHLAEMNHSPAFWAVVERLFPDHASCRRWLRDHGQTLHQVRFGS
jgi:predicted metal-dependent hydrolase